MTVFPAAPARPRNAPPAFHLLAISFLLAILIALASGFLITTVTQSMIPKANKEGKPSFTGSLFVAGISIYALLALLVG